MLKTNESNLTNHPFILFLQILCFLEANGLDLSKIHGVYLDCTGSFHNGLLKKRFPKACKAIVHVPAFDGLGVEHLPTKPSKFTFLFSDSLIYKSSFDISDFDIAIFSASKEEELKSVDVLKVYSPPDLFQHALGDA